MMNTEPSIRVGAILFAEFELLDLYGPLELYGLLEGQAAITVLAELPGNVRSSCGPSGVAEVSMSNGEGFDVLLVPGGIGTRREMARPAFVGELRRLAEKSRLVTTVCTGSLLLAATGLLDNRQATTNKLVFQEVRRRAPALLWQPRARWVEDGKFFSSSGVSAGMDMTLAVIAGLLGQEAALQVATRAEYTWHQDSTWDPFSVLADG